MSAEGVTEMGYEITKRYLNIPLIRAFQVKSLLNDSGCFIHYNDNNLNIDKTSFVDY